MSSPFWVTTIPFEISDLRLETWRSSTDAGRYRRALRTAEFAALVVRLDVYCQKDVFTAPRGALKRRGTGLSPALLRALGAYSSALLDRGESAYNTRRRSFADARG